MKKILFFITILLTAGTCIFLSCKKDIEVKLYDLQGKEIQTLHREQGNQIFEKQFEINQTLVSGIYLLRLTHGNNTFNSKIIKE